MLTPKLTRWKSKDSMHQLALHNSQAQPACTVQGMRSEERERGTGMHADTRSRIGELTPDTQAGCGFSGQSGDATKSSGNAAGQNPKYVSKRLLSLWGEK
eukprot:9660936-Alexandrium_andersonii.AAC.1